MTAKSPTTEHPSLAAALAAFQQSLPRVGTDNLGIIPGKDGKQGYKYKYANLAEVSHAALPLLAVHGLSWSCKPTLLDGKLVLHYVLRHTSGESDEGFWPLQGGTPQQLGSSITYGRRYCLAAVTGIAPDEDDDGQAAEQAHRQYPAVQRPDQPAAPADQARARLRQACTEHGWDLRQVASIWAAEHPVPLGEVLDPEQIDRFRESLSDQAVKPPATNGAPS